MPNETLADWRDDVRTALELKPDHLSTYGLTYEKGTRYWSLRNHGVIQESDEDLQRDMYVQGIEQISAAGYEHYEVSNFARPGHCCRHNEAYWTGRQYFGVGAGASRFVGDRRETNHRSTTTYLRRMLAGESPTAESEVVDSEMRMRERVVFGLRRLEGIDLERLSEECGWDVRKFFDESLTRFLELGLLQQVGTSVRLNS